MMGRERPASREPGGDPWNPRRKWRSGRVRDNLAAGQVPERQLRQVATVVASAGVALRLFPGVPVTVVLGDGVPAPAMYR